MMADFKRVYCGNLGCDLCRDAFAPIVAAIVAFAKAARGDALQFRDGGEQ